MSAPDRLDALIAETGVSFPRGVLGPEARAFASAIVAGAPAGELDRLRAATAGAHWKDLRLAIGAGLERSAGDPPGPAVARGLELVLDEDSGNPLALALAEEAGRSLAAVLARNDERLSVLEQRLAEGAPADQDLALVVGAIVADLLDLDPLDYEDEIAEYVGAGEGDAARRELARSTGDEESRLWAREELRSVDVPDAPVAIGAVRALAAGDPPADPAADPVWVATMLSLVEQAVEITVVSEHGSNGAAPDPG